MNVPVVFRGLMTDYQRRVEKLERELDEMTVALSQAWDQLVPFLQKVPVQAETAQDILPILQAVCVAADTDLAGIYLFQTGEWYGIPDTISLATDCFQRLEAISQEQTLTLPLETGHHVHWAFAPVVSESETIGVLGIGTYDSNRSFTAVDLRIIVRMAERIGSQVAAAQLARFREREAIQAREMQIANEIQQSVQPTESPHNSRIRMASYWQPAKEVGGDTWGWVQQDDGRLAWFILDVAGKGLPAALAAVALHTAISMALRMRLSPADALQLVNEHFYEAYTRTDLIATVAIVSLNPKNGALELANAGHPPVLVRYDGSWLRLAATAPPIGVLPDLDAEPQFLMLKPDDMVICYSDGFTEIETPTRMWGQTGLLGVIPPDANDVQALTEQIVAASRRVGTAHDDQTLIAARYSDGMEETISITATLEATSKFTEGLESRLQTLPLEIRTEVTLAVHELLVNIVKHAYAGTPGEIILEFVQSDSAIRISITDYADNHFTMPDVVPAPDLVDLPEGGMGLFIIHQSFDEVNYKPLPRGNCWRLVKGLGG